ncbi:MAG: carbohydrate ABC transporter permease [Caldilineaceae bacterium]
MSILNTILLGRKSQRTPSLIFNYLFLTLLALFALGPLVLLFINSLKDTTEVTANPFGLPRTWTWQNFPDAWTQGHYDTTVRNSAMITIGTVVGVVVIAGLAAYSLARLNPKGADALAMYLVVGTSIPAQLFMVPLFFLWTKLGLADNLLGVIIIYWGTMSPFATFLLRSFMISIPKDFDEAAYIDGASNWQVFWRIIVPICWPGFLTVALTSGLGAWNEFLFAVTFLHTAELKPVSTSLYSFFSRYSRDWGLINAATVIMILPVIILFLLLQRQFIQGLTQGGLKA